MKQLRFQRLDGVQYFSFIFFSFFFSFILSACNLVPEPVEDIGEQSVTTFEDVSDKLGKERQINEDTTFAPEQEDKIKIRF